MIQTKRLRPIKMNDLIRIGRDNDGGYVIPESLIAKCDALLSYGINKDWSFEKECLEKNPNMIVHAYDHTLNIYAVIKFTIKSVFLSIIYMLLLDKKRCVKSIIGIYTLADYLCFFKKKMTHFKHRIWKNNDENSKTVTDSIQTIKKASAQKIFIKMDIETAEYMISEDLFKHSDVIMGMAIEFHELNQYAKVFEKMMDHILQHYHIAHIHGNNYSPTFMETHFPTAIEITFIHKSLIEFPVEPSQESYPIAGLDQANRFSKPDCPLVF